MCVGVCGVCGGVCIVCGGVRVCEYICDGAHFASPHTLTQLQMLRYSRILRISPSHGTPSLDSLLTSPPYGPSSSHTHPV